MQTLDNFRNLLDYLWTIMKYDIFLEYHWSLNESEKLIFFRNKCYNRLRVRRRIHEKSTTRRSLGWHATDRQPPERPLIRQTRKREGRPLPPRFERRLLSALLHARIHLVARRVSKSVVSLNYSWHVFFSATTDHRPPSTRGEGRASR